MSFLRQMTTVALVAVALPLGFSSPGHSQESKTFLWAVETPTNTVYLLGSIHLMEAADYPFSPPILAAFEAAEQVVFEVDLASLKAPETTQIVLESALPDSPEEQLITALSPESYAIAASEAAAVGLPISAFHNFEPWFFSISLTALKLLKLGISPDYGLDAYLFQQATATGKTVLALETVAEQMHLFDTLSISTQQVLFEQTLAELALLEDSFTTLKTAWQTGDVATVESLISEGLAPYPEVQTALFSQRNQTWLTTIVPMLNQRDDYLIVVGAGHLVGADGLVQQLQSRGYIVQQR